MIPLTIMYDENIARRILTDKKPIEYSFSPTKVGRNTKSSEFESLNYFEGLQLFECRPLVDISFAK